MFKNIKPVPPTQKELKILKAGRAFDLLLPKKTSTSCHSSPSTSLRFRNSVTPPNLTHPTIVSSPPSFTTLSSLLKTKFKLTSGYSRKTAVGDVTNTLSPTSLRGRRRQVGGADLGGGSGGGDCRPLVSTTHDDDDLHL